MKKKTKKVVVDIVGDLAPSVGLAVAGAAIGGIPGAIVGGLSGLVAPVLKDVLARSLSIQEKERIELVAKLAQNKIQEQLDKGLKPRKDFDRQKAGELFEGVLLKAKDMYEAKKLPFIANLFARAPFTNTPIENMNQTLIHAEQLSYRQLCVLSIIGLNEWDKKLSLSDKPFMHEKKKMYEEKAEGIYQDILSMIQLGLIGQITPNTKAVQYINTVGYIVPKELVLFYPGRLLFNGLQLDYIDEADRELIIDSLKAGE